MAKLLWSIFCEKPIIDSKSNNVSLIGVIEALNVPTVPVVIPNPFFIVSLWQRSSLNESKPEDVEYRIVLITPKKREKQLIKYKFSLEKKRHRTLNGIFGLPIDSAGTHYFSIQQLKGEKWKEEFRIVFEVKKG